MPEGKPFQGSKLLEAEGLADNGAIKRDRVARDQLCRAVEGLRRGHVEVPESHVHGRRQVRHF